VYTCLGVRRDVSYVETQPADSPEAATSPGAAGARAGAPADAAAAAFDPDFISECWRCKAPVKSSWSVCPGCKVCWAKVSAYMREPWRARALASSCQSTRTWLYPTVTARYLLQAPTNKPEGEEGAAGGATDADDESLVAAERAAAVCLEMRVIRGDDGSEGGRGGRL
jgi:hypothetical protein